MNFEALQTLAKEGSVNEASMDFLNAIGANDLEATLKMYRGEMDGINWDAVRQALLSGDFQTTLFPNMRDLVWMDEWKFSGGKTPDLSLAGVEIGKLRRGD